MDSLELPPHPDTVGLARAVMRLCDDADPACDECPLCTLPQEWEGQECAERFAEVMRFPALYEVREGLVRPIFDRKYAGMENHAPRTKTGAWSRLERA